MSASSSTSREEVRDEEDRLPGGGERADDLVQLVRLLRAERRGGLVHDDQLRVARERAQDLDLLLLGGAQPAGGVAPGRSKPGGLGERGVARAERCACG